MTPSSFQTMHSVATNPHLDLYKTLNHLLTGPAWSGQQWLIDFAAESSRIGRAMGSAQDDNAITADYQAHKKRFDNGYSSLSRLHAIFMCQAAAQEIASWIKPSDLCAANPSLASLFNKPKRSQDQAKNSAEPLTPSYSGSAPAPIEPEGSLAEALVRRALIMSIIGRSFGEVNFSEQPAFFAQLLASTVQNLGLADESEPPYELITALKELGSKSPHFTSEGRLTCLAGLTGEVANLEPDVLDLNDNRVANTHSAFKSAYISASDAGHSATNLSHLLDYDYEPNSLANSIYQLAKTLFLKSGPDHALEQHFLSLNPVYTYDHPIFLAKYPHGLFDGNILLLPMKTVAAGMGTPQVFDHTKAVLSCSIRSALNLPLLPAQLALLEASSPFYAPTQIEPGALLEACLSVPGLSRAADMLLNTHLEQQRLESGYHASHMAEFFKHMSITGAALAQASRTSSSPAALEDALTSNFGTATEGIKKGVSHDQSSASPVRITPEPLSQTQKDDQLRQAIWIGNDALCTALIQSGSNVHAASALQGTTPLMVAAAAAVNKSSDESSMQWLKHLMQVCDLGAKDLQGQSVLDYALHARAANPFNQQASETAIAWITESTLAHFEQAELSRMTESLKAPDDVNQTANTAPILKESRLKNTRSL